ncbi:NADH-quinone oxidoreductase subunit N [Chloroflexia bacterium SDU3-3]|nr:NADH-quinone oxidoreductase subunit N [Chloroflexia bacterium SDU3-3]
MSEKLPLPLFENIGVVLPMAIAFGWAIILLVIDLFVADKRAVGWLAVLGLAASAVAAIIQPTGTEGTFLNAESRAPMIGLDPFAQGIVLVALGVAIITVLLALEYLPRQGIERGEFYPLVMLATGAIMLLAQGQDLIALFLGLELLSIILYILAGFAHARVASEEAAIKYLIFGGFATGFLVFAIALIYGATGKSSLGEIAAASALPTFTASDNLLLLIGIGLLIVGFGYKVSMAPFHMWTPDVYEGSPTPVTAFMSVAVKAGAFAALARLLVFAFGAQAAVWLPILAITAALTMLAGNIGAVVQTNVKRMLAYSSVGHAGYILLGVIGAGATAANRELGLQSVVFYLVTYALSNMAAFGVLIALERRGEAAWSLDDLSGLFGRSPWLATAMTLAMLSLAGVPLTAGFVGKLYVFSAVWSGGLGWLTLIGVATSAISAFFYLRVILRMFTSEPSREVQTFTGTGLRVALVVAAVGILLVGVLPGLVVSFVQHGGVALGL